MRPRQESEQSITAATTSDGTEANPAYCIPLNDDQRYYTMKIRQDHEQSITAATTSDDTEANHAFFKEHTAPDDDQRYYTTSIGLEPRLYPDYARTIYKH